MTSEWLYDDFFIRRSGVAVYLQVFGPGGSYVDQQLVGEQLAAYLNGGIRPLWLDDVERTDHDTLHGCDHTMILAIVDGKPYDDEQAKYQRLGLIDQILYGIVAQPQKGWSS